MKLSTILGKDYEKIVGTLTEEEIICVVEGLKKKNVKNPLTIRFALDYLYSHKKVYGDIIDTMEVAEKIVENLDKDLAFCMSLSFRGEYLPRDGQIKINLITTARSFLSRKRKCNVVSTLRHEFDHCVTTGKNYGFEKNGDRICFRDSCKDADKMLSEIDSEDADKLLSEIDGVAVYKLRLGWGLDCLDEGITVFKQRKFDEANGLKSHRQSVYYEIYFGIAKHIANVIGEKEMVKFQYEGDFMGMYEKYSNKTGMNLAVIVGYLGWSCSGCYLPVRNYKQFQARKKELEKGRALLTYLENAEKDLLDKQKEDEKE